MRFNKKALSAAITLSLVLGVYGVAAGATISLFGTGNSTEYEVKDKNGDSFTIIGANTTKPNPLITTGANYEVTGGEWDSVRGGYSGTAAVSSNTVNISGGVMKNVRGGDSNASNATSNTVNISGGTITYVRGGYSDGSGTVSSNTVTISGGTISENVYGGYSLSGTVSSNTVTVSGGTINGALRGGWSKSGTAEGNTINLGATDGTGYATVNGDVYINYANGTSTSGGTLNVYSLGNTMGKNLYVNGANVNFYIPKTAVTDTTMVKVDGTADLSKATINTDTTNYNGDTITLLSAGTLNIENATYQINGTAGKTQDIATTITGMTNVALSVAYDTSVANKLSFGATGYKLTGDSAITGEVTLDKALDANKQALNFYIPATAVNGATMLTVNQEILDLSNSDVKAGMATGSKLNRGDKINLISNNGGTITDPKSTGLVAEQGFTDYQLGISVEDGKRLTATVKGQTVTSSAKSTLETIAASLTMLNQGSDMLAEAGLESAVKVTQNQATDNDIFAALSGSKSRVETGSHVDLKGINFNLGYAKAIPNESGKLVIGPVVEYGKGNYDSYLDNGFHADGNTKYVGAGLVGKQLNNNGFYYEGSIRGGKTMNDYKSSKGEYDTDSIYLAAHFGIGKVFPLKNNDDVDVYGKYFFTHQNGDETENRLDKFHFNNADSHRARLGFRYNHKYNEANTFYGGLAWQYEFSGETAGSVNGMNVDAPSLKGHTGILELGWKVEANKNFDFSMGLNAYTGVERGAGANVKMNWRF